MLLLGVTPNNGACDRCQNRTLPSTPILHCSSEVEGKRRLHLVVLSDLIKLSAACTAQWCHFKVTSPARCRKHRTTVLRLLLLAHAHIPAHQAAATRAACSRKLAEEGVGWGPSSVMSSRSVTSRTRSEQIGLEMELAELGEIDESELEPMGATLFSNWF